MYQPMDTEQLKLFFKYWL